MSSSQSFAVASIALACALLGGCSSPDGQVGGAFVPPEGTVALPFVESDSGMDALLIGPLEGDEDLGCVWLLSDSERIALVWPAPHFALFDPLRIIGPGGEIVWEEGQVLEAGGGFSRVDGDVVPEGCRVGAEAWWMSPTDG